MSSTEETRTVGPIVVGVDDLSGLAGKHLGYGRWHEVTQDQVNTFADATLDHQWIHVDVERAAAGPFGGTIAHGYLTLSLGPAFLEDVLLVSDASAVINYGLNKVRFPAPVPVDKSVRAGIELRSVEEVSGGVQAELGVTFEIEGESKPGCVAEVLYRFYR